MSESIEPPDTSIKNAREMGSTGIGLICGAIVSVSAFLNVCLLPGHPNTAFWLGGVLGLLVFLKAFKIPRIHGAYYMACIAIAFMVIQYNGFIAEIAAGLSHLK